MEDLSFAGAGHGSMTENGGWKRGRRAVWLKIAAQLQGDWK
jgi:hypothetical protein